MGLLPLGTATVGRQVLRGAGGYKVQQTQVHAGSILLAFQRDQKEYASQLVRPKDLFDLKFLWDLTIVSLI